MSSKLVEDVWIEITKIVSPFAVIFALLGTIGAIMKGIRNKEKIFTLSFLYFIIFSSILSSAIGLLISNHTELPIGITYGLCGTVGAFSFLIYDGMKRIITELPVIIIEYIRHLLKTEKTTDTYNHENDGSE